MATDLATCTARLDVTCYASHGTAHDLATPNLPINQNKQLNLTYGVGAAKVNQVWADTRTLGAGANESLQLSAAAQLKNAFGGDIVLNVIRIIYIENTTTTTTGSILVGGAAANAWGEMFGDDTDKIRIRAGGVFAMGAVDATGFAVQANDVLKIENEDGVNTATYSIIIVGEDTA